MALRDQSSDNQPIGITGRRHMSEKDDRPEILALFAGLIVVVVILAWGLARGRSRNGG